jgi:trans-2,3-dihydro-3-hydroxyanthranilate isomerase
MKRSTFGMLLMVMVSSGAFAGGRTYEYSHLDVFTDTVLTGNQLAVFLAPSGLTDAEMQNIAREMAFSETTFVFPVDPSKANEADFRVRIFGTNRELDFAGHPTIGTAFALARAGRIAPGTKHVTLQEGIGPIPVDLEWKGNDLSFAWMGQLEPTFGKSLDDTDVAAAARALSIDPSDTRSTGLPVQEVSCGAMFLFVPLATRAAVDRAVLDRAAMGAILEARGMSRRGVFLYSAEPGGDDATVYSRMLSFNVVEDPATGSASGPLGAYLVHHGVVPKGEAASILSRQGVKMGRPSRIHIRIGLEGDTINKVEVGGSSVFVGTGTVELQ